VRLKIRANSRRPNAVTEMKSGVAISEGILCPKIFLVIDGNAMANRDRLRSVSVANVRSNSFLLKIFLFSKRLTLTPIKEAVGGKIVLTKTTAAEQPISWRGGSVLLSVSPIIITDYIPHRVRKKVVINFDYA